MRIVIDTKPITRATGSALVKVGVWLLKDKKITATNVVPLKKSA